MISDNTSNQKCVGNASVYGVAGEVVGGPGSDRPPRPQ